MYKVGDILEIDLYSEICCEDCNEVIHNHVDCPVCGKDYADTDKYCSLYEEKEFTCENCNTVYAFLNSERYYGAQCEIIYIAN